MRTNVDRARRAVARLALGALLAGIGVIALPAAPVHAAGPAFVGYCTPDAANPQDGSCTLDEPEGKNPATYGTVTYDRTVSGASDTLSFDRPNTFTATEVQICLTLVADSPASPYVPTSANTCAGNSPDRAYSSSSPPDPVVVDVDAFFAGNSNYTPGAALWFTVHINGEGRTMYVTGSSNPPQTPPTRSLVVTKEVTPNASGTFSFAVDCAETTLSSANTTTSGVTFSGGNASFTLADDGAAGFTGILDGDTCTVTESDPGAGWSTTANGAAGRVASVLLDGANGTAAFVNVPPPHSLTVSKAVVNGAGGESFAFTVDCGSYDLSSANSSAAGITYAAGDAALSLGNGASAVLANIPHGTVCTVSESVPSGESAIWTTAVNGAADDDRSASATLDADRTLAFTNTKAITLAAAQQLTQDPPAVAAAAEERIEVQGVQVAAAEATLPRTGPSSFELILTALALMLLALGGLLLSWSRPALAHSTRSTSAD